MARTRGPRKSDPAGYKVRARNSRVRFVGDAEAPPVQKARRVEPVRTLVVATDDKDYVPVPYPSLDMQRLLASSVPGLTWTWWSCPKCRHTFRGIHWWALFPQCSHDNSLNVKSYGTFPAWLESMGLTLERMSDPEATENPWA